MAKSRESKASRRGGRLIGLAALASAATLVGATASAATGWSVVTVPQTGNNTQLNGAFARTDTDVWAVGQQFRSATQGQLPPVSYHWDGTSWSLILTAGGTSLNAVSSSSATDAWAVGFTLAGRARLALYQHWNGTAWSIVAGPGAGLVGVADLSPANAYAIGTTVGTVDHWDGTLWTATTLPDVSFAPGAITALSAADIWLVGDNASTGAAEAMHFDGTGWSTVPMQQPAQGSGRFAGAAFTSPSDVWAVGTNSAGGGFIEHWNGTAWSITPISTTDTITSLTAVAARSSTDAFAVGTDAPVPSSTSQHALILRWNGSSWTPDAVPIPGGTFSPLGGAATVPGGTREWAVGIFPTGPDPTVQGAYSALVLSHG